MGRIEIKDDNQKFEKYLEVLIRKYEYIVSHTTNEVFTFLGFFITSIIAIIIAYIGWNIESLKISLLIFWGGSIFLKLIMFSIMFTLLYFTYKLTTWVMRRKTIESRFLKFLRITDLIESNEKLNKLYLAKIDKKGWIMKVEVNNKKGVLELIDISKAN